MEKLATKLVTFKLPIVLKINMFTQPTQNINTMTKYTMTYTPST